MVTESQEGVMLLNNYMLKLEGASEIPFFFLNKDIIGNFLCAPENTILTIPQICFYNFPEDREEKINCLIHTKNKKETCQCGLTSKPPELWFGHNGFPLPLPLI